MANQNYLDIIRSDPYQKELRNMATRIKKQSKIAPNEATIESNFDCELFAFFRSTFSQFGFEYNPVKEKAVSTRRNILSGRADTAIAKLVIEFKQPKTLDTNSKKAKAINQLSDYIHALKSPEEESYLGFVTDGVIGCFVRLEKGALIKENFYELDEGILDRIIKNIINVKLVTLNARNLVEGLCNPPDNDGVAFEIMHALFEILDNNIHPKTQMLFNEWMQLFNLAHDDVSKQQAIIDRRQSLEVLFGKKFSSTEEEYKALFALQTAYAIIVKIIAFKVVSQVRYNKSLVNFHDLMALDEDALHVQMEDLENGAIFSQYGTLNLLEGDFFSWYASEHQWTDNLYKVIRDLCEKLSKYADVAVTTSAEKAQDFFKELYQSMIPAPVRHSLGEYYTKRWLATCVIEEALSKCPKLWRALDPCCGSGTFLSVLIEKVLDETKNLSSEARLLQILSRVKGIDLNPIAALTARVNYFINIASLIKNTNPLEIPVYLGDASYVPQRTNIGKVSCLKYTISTLKDPIEVIIPVSMVENTTIFSQTMSQVETYIESLDEKKVYKTFCSICNISDLTNDVRTNLKSLAKKLVSLEKRKWNGIWARILTNFLTTANIGKFNLIVGNPPWVDWKSLPSGYRDRIKTLCISKHLFSGDSVTGGINLNICALITNVVAQNWLAEEGVIAFLMPEPLVFQQSYEGFRNLYIDDKKRMYFYKFVNWDKAGSPFAPVNQKFLSFHIGRKFVDYSKGVPVDAYEKKIRQPIDSEEILDIKKTFRISKNLLVACHENKNFFTYVNTIEEAKAFRKIAGDAEYIGREGIEFYPQELMVFTLSNLPKSGNSVALDNMQNPKSKYKVHKRTVLLETELLRPMIKGKDVTPFHVDSDKYIVPFPYEKSVPKYPIKFSKLLKKAPKLAKYYNDNKKLINSQTSYNERIIGNPDADFYALARVGPYSYAQNYVVFRDNSKWAAAVISDVETAWGGKKLPAFQNHAVSICEDSTGRFITKDEAHYICAILNSPTVYKYMMTSSDSRSFPIRPRIKIPKYNQRNVTHKTLSNLSKKAHKIYDKPDKLIEVLEKIDKLYRSLL